MSVVSINMLSSRSQDTFNQAKNTIDRKYTNVIQIITNDKNNGEPTVRSALALAGVSIGSTFVYGLDSDTTSFCQDIQIESDAQDGLQWRATVEYGPVEPPDPDPTAQPVKVSWGSTEIELPIEEDKDGNAIVNSAGDPFNPVPTHLHLIRTITVTQNTETWDSVTMDTYHNKLNNATFFGYPAKAVLLKTVDAELSDTEDYYIRTYTFWADGELLHVLKLLDCGYRTLDPDDSTNQKNAIVDAVPANNEPILLNGEGGKLPANDTPVFMEFDIYNEVDFSVFGFGV